MTANEAQMEELLTLAQQIGGWERARILLRAQTRAVETCWQYRFSDMAAALDPAGARAQGSERPQPQGVYVFDADTPQRRIMTCTQSGTIAMFDANLAPLPWRMREVGAPIECVDSVLIRWGGSSQRLIAVGTVDHRITLVDDYGDAYWSYDTGGEVYGLRFCAAGGELFLLSCGADQDRGELTAFQLTEARAPRLTRVEAHTRWLPGRLWSLVRAGATLYLGGDDLLHTLPVAALSAPDLPSPTPRAVQSADVSVNLGEVRSLCAADIDGDGVPELLAGTTRKQLVVLKELGEGRLRAEAIATPKWIRRVSAFSGHGQQHVVACADTGAVFVFVASSETGELRLLPEWVFRTDREVREVYVAHATPVYESGEITDEDAGPRGSLDRPDAHPVLVFVSRCGGVSGQRLQRTGRLLEVIRSTVASHRAELERNLTDEELRELSLFSEVGPLVPHREASLLRAETVATEGAREAAQALLDAPAELAWRYPRAENRVRSLAVVPPDADHASPQLLVGWGPFPGGVALVSAVGEEVWRAPVRGWGFAVASGAVGASPSQQTQLVVGATDLIAFDRRGSRVWSYRKEKYVGGAVRIVDGLVFSGSAHGDLYLFDGRTTDNYLARARVSENWIRGLACAPYRAAGYFLVVGDGNGRATFVVADRVTDEDGLDAWRIRRLGFHQTSGFISDALELRPGASTDTGEVTDFHVYIGSTDGSLRCLRVNLASGSVGPVWPVGTTIARLDDWIKALRLFDVDGDGEEELVVGCTDGYVYVLAKDGRREAGFPCGDEPRAVAPFSLTVSGDTHTYIATGSEAGGMSCFRYFRDADLGPLRAKVAAVPSPAVAPAATPPPAAPRAEVSLEGLYLNLRQVLTEPDGQKQFEAQIREHTQRFSGTLTKEARQDIEFLAQSVQESRCLPFAGAGLSVEAGAPSSDRLKRQICDSLGVAPGLFTDLAEAAQYLVVRRGSERAMVDFVADAIQTALLDSHRSCVAHALLRMLGFRRFITTNYDSLLEDQFQQSDVVLRVRPLQFLYPTPRRRAEVFKIHGDFNHRDLLDISLEQYLSRGLVDEDKEFRVTQLFLENNVLFLGYSFRDLDIQRLYHRVRRKLGGDAERAFIVLHEDNEYTECRERILRSLGLSVVRCDTRLLLSCIWCQVNRERW